MARLIKVDDIKWRSTQNGGWERPYEYVTKQDIDRMPTVDAVEVVHGRWVWKPVQNKHWILTCSVCSGTKNASEDCIYCANCGAKMDLEEPE